ncbi:alpha/beta fold hydrolase [Flagellimonas meridianipacifica]|uniref:Pimeloyl-ACP methyl ester carboxylesterase n=1 Tax=Flagellimonas meridianipacifica TaxID=1080225 RepID=A0A2T0MBG9_9FLAO|nr:alpha/beta hydrolase [Allomuricauda pacifica]PRX54762.1 pimeloyl-ACP methyl ester carboxylesterase [Allomuricauda pacifica]
MENRTKVFKRFPKKRYILLFLTFSYLLFANSCMTMRTSTKKTAAFFNEKNVEYISNTVEIDGNKVHYVQTGKPDAPTLVFIHGSPGSWDAYKNYLVDSTLSSKFRIIAPDRPGFGKSGFRRSASLAEQSAILNQIFKKMDNGKPISLIGHSYGGPLIVKMALDAPLYDNLVILAGALDPKAEKPEKWRVPLTWIPLKYLVPGALKPSNDELWLLKKELKELEPSLNELRTKTLIIHGKKDKLVPYSNVPFMVENFKNVDSLKVVTLENENHFIVWTQEELVKKTILDWTKED